MKKARRRAESESLPSPLFGLLGAQALVEYGILNSLARDATAALQRFGGFAAQHWYFVGGVLAVLLYLALRPRR